MAPNCPTDEEKYAYLNQDKGILYAFGTFSSFCLIAGMVLFSIQHGVFLFYLAFVILTAFYLSISYFIGIFGKPFDFKKHQQVVRDYSHFCPSVDIYLPNCGEDIWILENTFRHTKNIDWENKKVYVLDDKGRDEVKILADKFGFEYISRPNKGELKKAGNLRYAFPRSSGEFIIIFDADFAARPDFIKELIPYFAFDPKIGIVQSPQYFQILPQQHWVQKGAAYIQELFYRLIQVNRNTWGASICVGTNAIYRRASLEPCGGTYPIAHSEDVHTGFQILEAGGKVVYVPINLAKGLCPDNLSSFFIQQYRWATGSTSMFLSKRFWKVKLPLMVRLNFLSGMLYYWATALGIIMTPLPSILMVWFLPQYVFWFNIFFSLPSFIFGTFYMAVWTRAPFGWYGVKSRFVSYYAHLFAIFDKLTNKTAAWVPSGAKNTKVSRYENFRTFSLYWSSFVAVCILGGIALHMKSILDYNFYPTLAFTLFNYVLSISILLGEPHGIKVFAENAQAVPVLNEASALKE